MKTKTLLLSVIACVLTQTNGAALAADPAPICEAIPFDVSQTPKMDHSAPDLAGWTSKSPAGVTLSANRVALLRDGKPMPLVVGEFHPQRYPVAEWEEAILKMKAGGLNAISCYWFWTFIEPRPGKFDFTGHNDARRFFELCKKHNMMVFARIGPFCNAEILCGGLPPWIFGMPFHERSNEKGYLDRVQLYYIEMGKQMKGLLWKEGGPIFMLQIENELALAPVAWKQVYRYGASEENRGPTDPEEFAKHYENLRTLAINAGIDVPFYAVTAWGMKGKPRDHFVYCYGGYMYLGQSDKNSGLTLLKDDPISHGDYPIAFIELGAAGSPARQGWVPMPPVESAISTAFSKIGSTNSLVCGWYMYHGGTSPLHPDWGWSTKGDNLALMSYDFNAPLSEYGVRRPAYYQLRPFHQALVNFSDTFAQGKVFYQNPAVKTDDDKIRASVRMGDKDGGVAFLLHYANIKPLSDRTAHLELKTATGDIRVPSAGEMNFKNGDCIMLPFNMDLGNGVKLVGSTAQLSSCIKNGGQTVYFGSTLRDQEAELVFQLPANVTVKTSGQVRVDGERTVVILRPSLEATVVLESAGGKSTALAILPVESVRHSVEATLNGQKTYLISDQDIISFGNAVRLTSKETNQFTMLAYPEVAWKGMKPAGKTGLFSKIQAEVKPRTIKADFQKVDEKKAQLRISKSEFDGLNNIYAKVDFQGYLCRIFDTGTGLPVGDQLGDKDWTWWVSLKRFSQGLNDSGLVFYATSKDGEIQRTTSKDGMVLEEKRIGTDLGKLNGITFRPEYKLELVAQ